MSTTAIAARTPSTLFPLAPDLSVRPRVGPGQLRVWWDLISYWPAELLRLVALIYMLPIVIYVIGGPIAVVVNAVLFCAGWSWTSLWQ